MPSSEILRDKFILAVDDDGRSGGRVTPCRDQRTSAIQVFN